MNIDDSGEFSRRITALAEVFDKKLTTTQVAIYFEALRELPFEKIAAALNVAVKACKFFPRPVELLDFARGDAEDATEAAWIGMRQAMTRVGAHASLSVRDAALGETILAMFGSWPAACGEDFTPEMWASKRKEFGRVYRVMRMRRLEGARYLAGMCEIQNQGHSDWMKFVPVGRIDGSGMVRTHLPALECEQERMLAAAQAHGLASIRDGMTQIAGRFLEAQTDGAA